MTYINTSEDVPSDLNAAIALAYSPSGYTCTNLQKEPESEDYGAFTFEMNSLQIKFRIAKITPTKVGQFVTLWKRIGEGGILPHDLMDPIDLFVVSVRNDEHFGQFVFPKAVLAEKGILSKDGKGGKRAMRIYPPWDITDSQQARNTQTWQLKYFLEIPEEDIDLSRLKKLFYYTPKKDVTAELVE